MEVYGACRRRCGQSRELEVNLHFTNSMKTPYAVNRDTVTIFHSFVTLFRKWVTLTPCMDVAMTLIRIRLSPSPLDLNHQRLFDSDGEVLGLTLCKSYILTSFQRYLADCIFCKIIKGAFVRSWTLTQKGLMWTPERRRDPEFQAL